MPSFDAYRRGTDQWELSWRDGLSFIETLPPDASTEDIAAKLQEMRTAWQENDSAAKAEGSTTEDPICHIVIGVIGSLD
jgi:hypothetical protein